MSTTRAPPWHRRPVVRAAAVLETLVGAARRVSTFRPGPSAPFVPPPSSMLPVHPPFLVDNLAIPPHPLPYPRSISLNTAHLASLQNPRPPVVP